MKTYSVQLRVYRGEKSYNKHAEVKSANQLMDITPYLSMEWNNWMKNARNAGYTDAEVVKVRDIVHTKHTERDGKEVEEYYITTYPDVKDGDAIVDEIKSVVKAAFEIKNDIPLTPEQKEIKELKEQMAALVANSKGDDKTSKSKTSGDDELEKMRVKYESVIGEAPHHKMGLKAMIAKIEAHED